ncbi:hypothetical protein WN48_06728 [Eufriesea mexicana]|uniref:Uncharacterized protein n=1 Tax=Eufriesea mexicana TaxID=516756 RepID=A0A310SJU7_9HYME|nr:hypothetical protein WN48_06728 [Eufriesea mexicana]
MKPEGQGGGKTEAHGPGVRTARGRIDKASWKFLTLAKAEAAGEETTAIGQEMKLDKFNAAARRLFALRGCGIGFNFALADDIRLATGAIEEQRLATALFDSYKASLKG